MGYKSLEARVIIATALKHMLAAGMDYEAIIAAVAEMETGMSANTSQPVDTRSKAAIRNVRYRENLRLKTSQNVTNETNGDEVETPCDGSASHETVRDAGNGDSPPLPPPPPSFPQTPNQPPPPPAPPCVTGADAHEGLGSDLFGTGEEGGDDGEDNTKPKAKEKSKREEPFELPSHIPTAEWDAYREMRKAINKPLKTPHAMRLAVKALDQLAEDGHPPGAVLDQSTLNSWQGLFALKDGRNGTGNYQTGARQSGSRATTRADEMDIAYRDLVGGHG
jgi:hypothetical protein